MAPTSLPQRDDGPGREPLLRSVLGEVLRRERGQQARTLADVATAARVSMPYLSEIERGRKEASSEVLSAVCAALSIELASVLAEAAGDLAAHGRTRARAERQRAVRAERALGTRGSIVSIAPRARPTDGTGSTARTSHSPLCLAA